MLFVNVCKCTIAEGFTCVRNAVIGNGDILLSIFNN